MEEGNCTTDTKPSPEEPLNLAEKNNQEKLNQQDPQNQDQFHKETTYRPAYAVQDVIMNSYMAIYRNLKIMTDTMEKQLGYVSNDSAGGSHTYGSDNPQQSSISHASELVTCSHTPPTTDGKQFGYNLEFGGSERPTTSYEASFNHLAGNTSGLIYNRFQTRYGDPEAHKPKPKRFMSKDEHEALESIFKKNEYPSSEEYSSMSSSLDISKKRIINWFQNSRNRKKISEVSISGAQQSPLDCTTSTSRGALF